MRCGRLLTSEYGILHGYGCRCAELSRGKRRDAEGEQLPGQISLVDWMRMDDDDE